MNEIPFTLDQLLVLKNIATLGSFKKAADSLYISQPAVSIQIQRLERQLNVQLLDRRGKQTNLTEAGYLLLHYGERILSLCEETRQCLEDFSNVETGNLIIGTSETPKTFLMPELLSLFEKKYPNIKVELEIDNNQQLCAKVAEAKLDIAFIINEIPQELTETLNITPFTEEKLALILPCSHPFCTMEEIKKTDIYTLNFIALSANSILRKVIDTILCEHEIDITRLKIEMEFNSIETIKSAVQSGFGAAFVFASSINKEVVMGLLQPAKIQNVTLTRKLFLVTKRNRYRSKAVEKFHQELFNFRELHLQDSN